MELKLGCGVWGVWISWGIVGNGYGRDMGGVPGGCTEISEKFPGNFREITGNFREISRNFRNLQYDVAEWENKILIHGLCQNYPTIMMDSPVQYLRNFILPPITHFYLPPSCRSYDNIICIEL